MSSKKSGFFSKFRGPFDRYRTVAAEAQCATDSADGFFDKMGQRFKGLGARAVSLTTLGLVDVYGTKFNKKEKQAIATGDKTKIRKSVYTANKRDATALQKGTKKFGERYDFDEDKEKDDDEPEL